MLFALELDGFFSHILNNCTALAVSSKMGILGITRFLDFVHHPVFQN
jgi:hypothetical protein